MAGMNSKQPPAMRDGLPYAEWKKELDIWSDFTELDAKRQGGALFLTLQGKAREAVLSGVSRDKIKSLTGVDEIVKCLDELYEKDKSQSAFAAYEDFTSYRRSSGTSIQDYIVEFNLKYNKIKVHSMKLPDAVLAFYLLKCANLSEEHSNICKATCSELTYKEMRKQIEKVTADIKVDSKSASNTPSGVEEVYPQYYGQQPMEPRSYGEACPDASYASASQYEEYSQSFSGNDQSGYSGDMRDVFYQQQWQGRSRGPYRGSAPANFSSRPRINPPDEFGNPSRCSFCRSIYHWVDRCLDAQQSAYDARRRGPRRSPRGRASYRGGRGGLSGGARYDTTV